jgi:hypothetical protein
MGLCKCPKKKVTTQFCFEHRVNVCENCMVTNHTKCVIQSYLQWLQDSDYNPTCQLCRSGLETDECVRLVCYHVFHWSCLNRHAQQLPTNTAPAGYTCPTCQSDIFPPDVLVSPVADKLRGLLCQADWGRAGLGLPLIAGDPLNVRYGPEGGSIDSQSCEEQDVKPHHESDRENQNVQSQVFVSPVKDWAQSTPKSTHSLVNIDSYATPVQNSHYTSGTVGIASPILPKRVFDARDSEHFGNVSYDHDENKYRRRSPFEWFTRWLKLVKPSNRQDPHRKTKKYVMIVILCLVGLLTLIALMIRAGRTSADEDPFLDPLSNPNIHVEGNGGIVEKLPN